MVSILVETLCELCMPEAFCELERCTKRLGELCALCERKTYPQLSSVFFFSQKNTEEQNTQTFTETLSQPISQNVTAIFSWNVLWILYAGGLLWARNVRQKAQWTLCALWEKNLSTTLKCFLFLTEKPRRTEHTGFKTSDTHRYADYI